MTRTFAESTALQGAKRHARWRGAIIAFLALFAGLFAVVPAHAAPTDPPMPVNASWFSASKVLAGSGVDLVPTDAEFTLAYSYPAFDDHPAGSGTMTLGADGTSVTSNELPGGAVVTFDELPPADVEGAFWGEVDISPETVTIREGSVPHVIVTNTILQVPEPVSTMWFSASKVLTGSGADMVPADAEFTLKYSYPAAYDFPAGSGTLTLRADGSSVNSEELPGGAVVTFEEVPPPIVPGAMWGEVSIVPSTVTISHPFVSHVVVTNEIASLLPTTSSFSASKVLTGTGVDLVPADAEFTLNYSYPAAHDFPAGSGSLTLSADGSIVGSGELPLGAVLTFAEVAPAEIDGAVWGEADIVPASLTIMEGAWDTHVVVTNPIEKVGSPNPSTPSVDTPSAEPSTPAVNTSPSGSSTTASELAATGTSHVVPTLVGIGMIVLGGAVFLSRRRHSV